MGTEIPINGVLFCFLSFLMLPKDLPNLSIFSWLAGMDWGGWQGGDTGGRGKMPLAFSFSKVPCPPVLLLGMRFEGRRVAAGCSAQCCIQALLGFIKVAQSGKQRKRVENRSCCPGSSACSTAVFFVSPHNVKGKRSG